MTHAELRNEVMRRLQAIGPRSVTASVVAAWGGEQLREPAVTVALGDLWEQGKVEGWPEGPWTLIVRRPEQTTLDVGL